MRRVMVVLAVAAAFLFSLLASPVWSQPIDYCEGNFDNDFDVDGSDAFVFKQDFGRSSLLDPCPVIECQTAEELEVRIVQLETQLAQLTALLANVTRGVVEGQDTIRFSNMNVQIVDGSGNTSGTVNGRGNLIVGYNELRGSGDNRTGSHNIVVGSEHNYSSYGGLVAGNRNTVSAVYASVSGGSGNTANAYGSSVSGGRYNVASGDYSFIGGGGYTSVSDGNEAFGHYTAILGGRSNITGDPDLTDHTFAQSATISGGQNNVASGSRATVSGGFSNTASHWGASVSGGEYNTASGVNASVSGGRYNEASGDYAFVGGGGNDTEGYGNTAFANYSAVLGGYENQTGDLYLTDHTIGEHSSISGGNFNKASGAAASVSGGNGNDAIGDTASVSGGMSNTASGQHSSVSGGQVNTANDYAATISGGQLNIASGPFSSVSGGNSRSATGDYDWRAGSCYFCTD